VRGLEYDVPLAKCARGWDFAEGGRPVRTTKWSPGDVSTQVFTREEIEGRTKWACAKERKQQDHCSLDTRA